MVQSDGSKPYRPTILILRGHHWSVLNSFRQPTRGTRTTQKTPLHRSRRGPSPSRQPRHYTRAPSRLLGPTQPCSTPTARPHLPRPVRRPSLPRVDHPRSRRLVTRLPRARVALRLLCRLRGGDPLREPDASRGDPFRRESSSARAPTQNGRPADRVLAHVGCRARSCRDCNVRPGAPFREGRVGLPLRGCAQPGGTSGPTEGQRPSGTDADSLSGCLSAVASVQ